MTLVRTLLACALSAPLLQAEPLRYNRDVRPILSENCFFCHGPDKNKRKAKLRLDERENAVERGAIVPGKPKESELVVRLFADDDTLMPPSESHKTLTAAQKKTLERWIEEGAKYEPHWAYLPIEKGNGAVDDFIRAELKKKNLEMSPEADRRTLLRRLHLDLLGLPPTPDEADAFVKDSRDDAWERVVDDALKRPEFGERMAVMWLDQVRFADTVGYHGDQNQRIFPYRDYVIKSFNSNKPFDVFTREQIAGDLLPNPTPEQRVATGFNRLNMMTREGGAQPKEYLAKYQADRVRTVSLAWLGSTLGCAECHDHKFDPFTAKDFYSMAAFFADVRQWGVYADYTYTPNPDLKGFDNDHPFPPEIEVDSEYVAQLAKETRRQIVDLAKASKNTAESPWRETMRAWLVKHPGGWQTLPTDEVIDGTPKKGKKDGKGTGTIVSLYPEPGTLSTLRLEVKPQEQYAGRLTKEGVEQVTLSLSVAVKSKSGERKLPLFHGVATSMEPYKYSGTVTIETLVDGWRIPSSGLKTAQNAQYQFAEPVMMNEGDELLVTMKADVPVRVGFAVSPLATAEIIINDLHLKQLEMYTIESQLLELLSTNTDAAFLKAVKPLLKEWQSSKRGKAWSQVTVAQKPLTTRLLPRGNFLDATGSVVLPATPGFLAGPASTEKARLTRLDLANWLVAKENPLTPRVFVNRLWKLFFGIGLSAGVEDIGAQGEWPSHPELLDYLANEFRDGWDVKRSIKTIVMSQAYRQASKARPDVKELDPNNRLVSYMSPRRLEAEFVRDNALSIAGLLNRDLYGPSAKPYQPGGYYVNIQFPNRDYVADRDRRQYRRGLYMHWQRTFLHPMLANFDAPSREECTANRTVANTPQQALTLLNDATFVEAARVLAARVDAAAKTDEDRLESLFQHALLRSPKPAERDALLSFLDKQRKFYGINPSDAKALLSVGLSPPPEGDAANLAAWTSICRVVLNLHECITRY